jgi:hypothetical protein
MWRVGREEQHRTELDMPPASTGGAPAPRDGQPSRPNRTAVRQTPGRLGAGVAGLDRQPLISEAQLSNQ